jgi:glycosyltransferase involved in cell wall biosynthesis
MNNKERQLRILIVEGSQSPPTFIVNLINGLVEQECEVGLLGKESSKDSISIQSPRFSQVVSRYSRFNFFRLLIDFCWIICINPRIFSECRSLSEKSGNKKVDTLRMMQLAKVLKFNPSIIHIQWASHLEEFTGLLNQPSRFKIIISLRGKLINVTPVVDEKTATFYRKCFPKVTAFHGVSKAIAQEASLYGAATEKISVIYSPIPEVFTQAYQNEYMADRTILHILSVGRFHWKKGYGYALDAMKILRERGVHFHYTIIAQGPVPNEIIHSLYTQKLTSYVTIINGVSYGAMIEEMKKYSVFLLSSLEEGIANVVLEAMAVGLPVISTNCGGMSEVVISNETGILVKRRDSESIANGLMAFQQLSESEVKRFRVNAWNYVKNNFSQPQQIAKFIQLYQSLS